MRQFCLIIFDILWRVSCGDSSFLGMTNRMKKQTLISPYYKIKI